MYCTTQEGIQEWGKCLQWLIWGGEYIVQVKMLHRRFTGKYQTLIISDVPLGNFFRDGYNDQFPFTVRACVEHGSLCVALVTLRTDVTRLLY